MSETDITNLDFNIKINDDSIVNLNDVKVADEALQKVTARWKSFMPESDRQFFGKIEIVKTNGNSKIYYI